MFVDWPVVAKPGRKTCVYLSVTALRCLYYFGNGSKPHNVMWPMHPLLMLLLLLLSSRLIVCRLLFPWIFLVSAYRLYCELASLMHRYLAFSALLHIAACKLRAIDTFNRTAAAILLCLSHHLAYNLHTWCVLVVASPFFFCFFLDVVCVCVFLSVSASIQN